MKMQNRNYEVTDPQKFVSDNLTHKPAASKSIWNNFALGVATVPFAAKTFDEEFNKSPEGQTIKATFDAVKRGNENEEVGWVQWGANEVANMVGQALNPATWVLGEAGGLAMKPLSYAVGKIAPTIVRRPLSEVFAEPFAKYFPEKIGKEGQTLSMGLFGDKLAQGFGIGAASMLPQATVDNFNAELNKHDILGIAKGMGMGGIFGMGISTIPFAYGIARANINRARGKAPGAEIVPGEADLALAEGAIDKDAHAFWINLEKHLENAEDKAELTPKATQYVASFDHPVDHANDTVQFEILNKDQVTNLQSATVDHLLSDYIPEEQRSALTDFSVQAGLDDVLSKPGLLDGVRGYVDYANRNLSNKESILLKADALVDEHLSLNEVYHGSELENGIEYNVEHAFPDVEFGRGYWASPSNVLAERYRRTRLEVNKIPGYEKIYDVNSGNDEELNKLYKKISDVYKDLPSTKSNFTGEQLKLHNEVIEKFRNKLKEKGYLGVQRTEKFTNREKKEKEIMFFEKPKSINENDFPLSQNSLYALSKENGRLPFSIPKEIAEKINQETKITNLQNKNEKLFKKYEKTGNSQYTNEMKLNNEKINELQENITPLKTPIEELKSIRNELISSEGLKDNYKSKKSYQRLQDLADVWPPAKTLLDRVKLEAEIKAQEAYRDQAKMILDIADTNIGKMTDIEKVKGYLEARTTPKINDKLEPTIKMEEVEKGHDVPTDAEIILAEQDRLIEGREKDMPVKEYIAAKEKFNEFKGSEGIFKNMINCVLGNQK
jgi:hypothetical protein